MYTSKLEEKNKIKKLKIKYQRKILENIRYNIKKAKLKKQIKINNQNYIIKQQQEFENLFNNIEGKTLDENQRQIVIQEEDASLVIAGAGSGKSLTIIAKIIYLIKNKVDPNSILCISFTNEASNSLKQKLKKQNINVNVITFHKLGYKIIKENGQYYKITNEKKLIEIIKKTLKESKNTYELLPDDEEKHLKQNKETNNYKNLIKLINTFINLFKSGNYKIKDFETFQKENKKKLKGYERKRTKIFLEITKQIIIKYQNSLIKNKEIDFNDMINIATKIVEKNGIQDYKYIIIDEYQDTSISKCKLIKAIKNQTNAKLLCVGDDFQSIYHFTGSDLKVFTNFKKYYKYAQIYKLENTYRTSQELLNIMGNFIMKNPIQIKKKLKSNKHQNNPIHIYYYKKSPKEIWDKVIKNTKNKQTLIIGRNNKDIKMCPSIPQNATFLTAHSAKGLESEDSIIINLENKITGFPNKIINDKVLNYVAKEETYPLAEERRLFYVAMTRAQNQNHLLVKKDNPSVFIKELINQKGVIIHDKKE